MSPELEMARIARRYPTDAKKRLWARLRRNALGWHFRRQHLVPLVLDFACSTLMIATEADGGQHNEAGEHDRRDALLVNNGWLALRFWNNEILENTDGVIAMIRAACQRRAALPPPQPSPAARERER